MIYTENPSDFSVWLTECLAVAPAEKLVIGIGSGAAERQLDAADTAEQLREVRRRGLAGFAFFALDDELIGTLLPALFP